MNDAIRMQLSAFVDGELPENEAELLIRRISQDAELRQEVAQYLAIGRLIRSDMGLSGADRLHQRVTAEIDDHEHPIVAESEAVTAPTTWATRPLAGIAVAATVALVAIFALQQNSVDDVAPVGPADPVAENTQGETTNPVPTIDVQEERQRAIFRRHAETSTALGANGINSRVVTLRFSEDLTDEATTDPGQLAADDSVEETDSDDQTVIQP